MQMQRYTDLTYDPNETYEQFCQRRQYALEQGRQAVRERRISGNLYLCYEYLIERVGANRYTWVSEDTLAEVFQVDASTIKRWMAKLVRAGIIRRQRQFATSSRTYITAYDPATVAPDDTVQPPSEPNAEHQANAQEVEDKANAATQEDQGTITEAVSFRRTVAPTFGADLPPNTIKVQHLNPGGSGAGSPRKSQRVVPEIRLLLEREGVMTFYVAPQIQHIPLDELRAVSRYLDQQHNVRDRARLFATLAVSGFGALLLSGQAQRPAPAAQKAGRPPKAGQRPDDHLKYLAGPLAPYIKGGPPQADPAPAVSEPGPSPTDHAAPPSATLAQTWQQALDTLRQALPAREFQTWFDQTALMDLDDARAIVGVPNTFARETLTRCYQAQIAQALHASCGRSVPVQIEIGG
jgi:hypothetical protein